MERKTKDKVITGEDIVVPPVQAPKKKKKSKRPKSKRGKNKPTGFEEYYVDAPMTVEEHHLELDLYHVSRPLIHRIEDALVHFQKNRRIESDRLEVFLKYLAYGGIDVGPKMFAGTDNRDLKDMDSDQILLARGNTAINQDHSNLAIDFNAVVRGYLTSYFPYFFNPENEDMIKLATVTIRSFLSYLLYHNVCPEYKENLDEARKSCDVATDELWKNQQLTANGPGDFNTACSTLFGGFQHDLYVENSQWKNPKDDVVQMTKDVALKVMKFGVAVAGTDELTTSFRKMVDNGITMATKLEDIDGFEVTEVCLQDDDIREFYEAHAPDLHPVGILRGKAYCDPGNPGYDLSPEEHEEWTSEDRPIQDFRFFLEKSLLEHCYPGMKIITSVWEMSCGFHYFEDIKRAYCSIYTVLANDLVIGWKKPRDLVTKEEDEESDAE